MPANIYIEGFIKDGYGEIIKNVLTQLLVNTTGQKLGEAVNVTDGYYSAWTVNSPATMSVVFSKPGYGDLTVPFNVLMENPDVVMSKNSAIPGWQVGLVIAAVAAIAAKKGGKVSGIGKVDTNTVVLILGGLLAWNVVQKILDKLGLGTDPTKTEQENPDSPWKPNYWKQFSTYSYAITESTAKQHAETIHEAFGVFQDDYNRILSVFSAIKTKANVSFISYWFNQLYNEDLLSFLTDGGGVLPWDGLSTEHLKTITNLVNNMPKN